jgi:hypothetical protein
MRLPIAYMVVLVAIVYFSCGYPEGPTNPMDPLSPNYVPTWPILYTSIIGTRTVEVSWVDRSLGELGFEVERSGNISSGYALLATVPTNVTSYFDTSSTLLSGNRYYYRVRAFTATVYSQYSNESGRTIP